MAKKKAINIVLKRLRKKITKNWNRNYAKSLRDDSPVLQIGDVWKAKSPIELLYQLAPG
jgi:hypothetical protein